MNILSIDTSCDDTSVAITNGRRVLSHVEFSQIKVHAPYGGVFPSLAKREHLTKIDPAIHLALKKAHLEISDINAIGITFGPGLPPALEVGVNKAKELATKLKLPLIPVDHIEGHIYSPFVQNREGKPLLEIPYPFLSFVISGGHTEIVLLKAPCDYQILGETLDDAAGEALDKAARLLGLGYPGGPLIETLSKTGDKQKYPLTIPMLQSGNLDFSFSGLKSAFKRLVYELGEVEVNKNLVNLAASFQNTVFTALFKKLDMALKLYPLKNIGFGGGVSTNRTFRALARSRYPKLKLHFPPLKYLNTDNASMIGVVAHLRYEKGLFLKNSATLDRVPRANLYTG